MTIVRTEHRMLISVFLVGFLCIMLELLQVRMLSFFLGSVINFLAIPVALLGLAMGSIYCHFVYRGDKKRLITILSVLVFPVLILAFLLFFFVADTFFYQIHAGYLDPGKNAAKLLIYSAIFLVPYFIFGGLFASFFSIGAKQIGRIYFFDLLGAGVACCITPILFTYTDLPVVIIALLFVALLLMMTVSIRYQRTLIAAAGVILVLLGVLSSRGIVFEEHPDAGALSLYILRGGKQGSHQEVAVRWNDLARTSLIKAKPRNPKAKHNLFAIVQEDGLSNVYVPRYNKNANRENLLSNLLHHAIPYHLDLSPKKILVMFAGMGRDMVLYDTLSKGSANIVGVEINHTVVNLANHPAVRPLRVTQFLRKPNINLTVKEGRDFLNNSEQQYDLIHVANNGSVHANRTGHTRKFLDTLEAMRSYLDHLAPGGLMLFANQPVAAKVHSFKLLFEERNNENFHRAVYAFGQASRPYLDSLLLKPSGFSQDETTKIEQVLQKRPGKRRLYSPFGKGLARFVSLVDTPLDETTADLVTDDRPFDKKISLADFEIFPDSARLKSFAYLANWIKIFTVLFFGVLSLAVIVVARSLGGRGSRIPLPWVFYFVLSGIAYMCVEIGLIAKTELFLGNPLYSIAVILSLFLIANSIGSLLQERYSPMRGPKTLILITAITIIWSVLSVEFCNAYLLSIPLVVKILAVAPCVMPAGIALGMYYPFGVSRLVNAGFESTVPMTYALTTLSSVLGSAYAMTAIINLGFSTIILIGAAGYLLVALVFLGAKRSLSSA